MRTYRIALLLCDVPLPPVRERYGDYCEIFETWLHGALQSYPEISVREGVRVVVDGFDVVHNGSYPPLTRLQHGAKDGYDAIMISGSKHTVHEMSPAFIPDLISWTRDICTQPSFLHLKVLGICFGHQIISFAMGGKAERGKEGWEIGVHGATLTEEGRKWFVGPVDGMHETERIFLQQMHRDHVPTPPEGFITTLRSQKYPIQGMVKHHPMSTDRQPLAHIFTLQGHPEFVPELVEMMVNYRMEAGIFDVTVGAEALRRAWGKDKQGGEGLVRVGWSMWRVMLA